MKYALVVSIKEFSSDGFGESSPKRKVYIASNKAALESKLDKIKSEILKNNSQYYWDRIESSNIFEAEEI
jgi:hypothetical protein